MERSFKALAKDGTLQYFQPDLVKKWLSTRQDKVIHILLDDDFKTTAFTAYYFSHVLEVIAEATAHKKPEVHEEMKKMFLQHDYELLGELYHDDISFRDLLQEKRHEFIMQVMAHWSQKGLTFENPDLFKLRKALK